MSLQKMNFDRRPEFLGGNLRHHCGGLSGAVLNVLEVSFTIFYINLFFCGSDALSSSVWGLQKIHGFWDGVCP